MPDTDEDKLQEMVDAIDDHPRVTLNADGTRSMMLNRPIQLRDREVTELVFKAELEVADLEESDKGKGDVAQGARLIAALSGVSYPNIRKLRADDFKLASLVIAKISGKDQETGGT